MQKSDCIIGVEHVSKFFGDKAVLNDVNLSVRKGEFVTILGPSGCGKTTLLRLIAGFQTASEGVITIAGSCRPCRTQVRLRPRAGSESRTAPLWRVCVSVCSPTWVG